MSTTDAPLDEASRRVQEALRAAGSPAQVRALPVSTSTAEEAGRAVGCPLGAIIKSLLFLADGRPVLVLTCGDRQVDSAKLAQRLDIGRKRIKMADADAVLTHTSFPVGGVPPLGHPRRIPTYVDSSVGRFPEVYAAAGTANTLFAISPDELVRITEGQLADITKERP
jgi:prolyl-tRNA editing enzyme YbaK/EbsC (Cys-tRNA(Pro) deacylase)